MDDTHQSAIVDISDVYGPLDRLIGPVRETQ